jgi:hypothetical protein
MVCQGFQILVLLTGCGKNHEVVRFSFFWGVVGNFAILKESMFVYVPYINGHKISVKGALGVNGGWEE